MFACKKTATKWTVCNDGDLELSRRSEECNLRILDVQCERRVFDLHGRNRVDGVGTLERCCGDFGETEILDLA